MVNVPAKGRIRVKAGVTIADGQRLYYQTQPGNGSWRQWRLTRST